MALERASVPASRQGGFDYRLVAVTARGGRPALSASQWCIATLTHEAPPTPQRRIARFHFPLDASKPLRFIAFYPEFTKAKSEGTFRRQVRDTQPDNPVPPVFKHFANWLVVYRVDAARGDHQAPILPADYADEHR